MGFVSDKQTLNDLNLLGQYKLNSIVNLFNKTKTTGGKRLLESMFRSPMTNTNDINKRKDIISFFHQEKIILPFNSEEFESIENYLMNETSKNRVMSSISLTQTKILNLISGEKEYEILKQGLIITIKKLFELKEILESIQIKCKKNLSLKIVLAALEILNEKSLIKCYSISSKEILKHKDVLKIDYVLRSVMANKINQLLNFIYELDVYISVSDVAREKGFIYATCLEKEQHIIEIKGVYHPYVTNAVSNNVTIDGRENVLFLTGANMAGKSTFMKSFALATYLAHMGFPIAADSMIFSVHDGIYTSINVPDDITKGYSHFYAEVLRVKMVAEEVAANKNLIIIFDELFKGTNVKDAYDGTFAITKALTQRKGMFVISTHIMEVGEELKKQNCNVSFKYLPTVMKENVPTYTYKLTDGISDDRQGMIIIKNEKILDIINNNAS